MKDFLEGILSLLVALVTDVWEGVKNMLSNVLGGIFGDPNTVANGDQDKPKQEQKQQEKPRYREVANRPQQGQSQDSSAQQTTTLIADDGKQAVGFVDVGHSGAIEYEVSPGKYATMNQEQLNALTYSELRAGVDNGSIKIVSGVEPGAVYSNSDEFTNNVWQAYAIKDQLVAEGMKVHMHVVPSTGISTRVIASNQVEADLFISVHNNASGAGANGTELFFPEGDARSERVAQEIAERWDGMPSVIKVNRGAKSETLTGVGQLGVFGTSSVANNAKVKVLLEGEFGDTSAGERRLNDHKGFVLPYAQSVAKEAVEGLVDELQFAQVTGGQDQNMVAMQTTPDARSGQQGHVIS